ncbi:HAD-IIIC family phosphatase [Streptomyces sp. MUM 178J]|uniref:HAD-IIIC family phosphatase n=1 Tax=Streptomyces sp. MUM 178J TaxID=2791991 RepID=UPI001F04A623|nr:HAD-IIIC family phosphatase [Streptomyces sp. MUM 178J]WRQ79980.1 HAD-IIIC family phosphatase [Streptomyces sp. MUM 178J]
MTLRAHMTTTEHDHAPPPSAPAPGSDAAGPPRTGGDGIGDHRGGDALAALRAAYAAGRLEAEYDTVRTLLARLPERQLAAAGQLLARLDRSLVRSRHPATPTLAVRITGQSTVGPLVAPLTAQLARHGILLAPVVSPYGSCLHDLLAPRAAAPDAPGLTLCLLDAHTVFEEVPSPWRVADVEAAVRSRLELLGRAVRTHQEGDGGPLVLNTVPLLRDHTHQLVDLRSRAALGAVWREFNTGLLALAQHHPGLVVIDLDPLIAQGIPAYEPRTAVYAKARLGDRLLAAYAREAGHLARARLGKTRKCLVLDLDGTLWGGVLGDDGPDGIEIGSGLRGEAYAEFQRTLKQLSSQGVLLAVSSKNDADNVLRALREHPAMPLREGDFIQINANWRPKHDNLRDIADSANLGLDGFVFVDDSSFERGLVQERLPEVAVVAVDEEPALHTPALLADGWFDVTDLTEEDRERTARYRTEAKRRELREDAPSYQEYLNGLDIEASLSPPTPSELTRVAQLTLRTNQFHLATERLRADDVQRLCARPGHRVLAVRARDRFGDHGLVGVVFLRRDGAVLRIDNYVLSCRVFSRGIESACLTAVLEHARATGARSVLARYLPSPRNAAFAGFYTDHGFASEGAGHADDDACFFRHGLHTLPPPPAHIRLHADFEQEHQP